MVVRRFKFEEPRMEQIQDLEVWFYTVLLVNSIGFFTAFWDVSSHIPYTQGDMMKYFREDLNRRLLSLDFKKQVDGLEMLQKVFGYFLDYWKLLLRMASCYWIWNFFVLFFPGPSIHWKWNNWSSGHTLEVVCFAVL